VTLAEPLSWTARPDGARAVVLVLHGGAEKSHHVNKWRNVHVLRLRPFAHAIARAGQGRIAVARLLFTEKGWNGDGAQPIAEARQALMMLRAAYPGVPIGVVGHSMGGRVALAIAGDEGVTAMVGLAPWVEKPDVARGGPGLRVLILHGTHDHITNPRGSQRMVTDLQGLGADAAYEPLKGENHALLRHPRQVTDRTARWLADALLAPQAEPAPPFPDRTS
jgi:alpha-beta hydrolase superfamily lysophospholipase